MNHARLRRRTGCGMALVASAAILSLVDGCATPRPYTGPVGAEGGVRGYRALFRGSADGPGGRARFRMAAALVPPNLLRLEFFGPVGGPRLVAAVDGARVIALLPGERTYDSGAADSSTLERILGLPLTPDQTVDLLTGRPMCEPEQCEQQVLTKAAAAFGRTVAWYQVSCPPGEIRYEARAAERGGILTAASVREGISGAMILEVEYDDHEEGLGPRWPRRIRIHLARRNTTIELVAIEGPEPGEIPAATFAPPVPEGFEKRPLLASLSAPGLLGSTVERGK